jgi:hypothetical protein
MLAAAPVGSCQEDTVDLLEVGGAGVVADGLDEGAEAEVARAAALDRTGRQPSC